MCPECTAITHIEDDTTDAESRILLFIFLGTVLAGLFGLCGCGAAMCMVPMMRRR
jgi:hypothetical protein